MKIISILVLFTLTVVQAGETIRVAIGTQDTTINCAAGGPVVRELKLFEKYLPRDGKYKDVNYEVVWLNLPTGAQLNSEILANRLDIVSMADFPSIVGHDAFLTQNNGVKTVYIASLSSGLHGAGNALLVPSDSSVQDIAQVEGQDRVGALCFNRACVSASCGQGSGLGSRERTLRSSHKHQR